MALAGLAFQVAKRSTKSSDNAYLMGELQSRVDLAATMRFDSLSLIAGCDTTNTGNVRIIGCTTVTDISARLKDVRIVVSTNVPGGRPDTVNMRRGKPDRPVPTR